MPTNNNKTELKQYKSALNEYANPQNDKDWTLEKFEKNVGKLVKGNVMGKDFKNHTHPDSRGIYAIPPKGDNSAEILGEASNKKEVKRLDK